MRSPFPGMDPYLERPSLWRDFYERLIIFASDMLQPQLVSRGYVSRAETRVWREEPGRSVYPDIFVSRNPRSDRREASPSEVLVADAPVFLKELEEEVEEAYLQIYEIGTRKLITGIEVISPSNKSGPARELYLEKRREFRAGGVSLVEIDLLRGGKSLVRLPSTAIMALGRDTTVVNIMRVGSLRYEFYPMNLRDPLPRITIPLKKGEPDAALDLQAAFERVYQSGVYDGEIDYGQPPDPPLSPENAESAQSLLSTTFGPPPAG